MAKTDWNEVFKNYKKANFGNIKEYVEQEQPEYKATLKEMVEAGKTFLAIKKEFYKAFFPQFVPVRAKEPRVSMKDALKDW